MITRIHVGLGGTDYTPTAIRYAVELAQAHQAEIQGATVIDRRRLNEIASATEAGIHVLDEMRRLERIEQRQERSVADLESACVAAGVTHTVARASGDPFEKMISLARYNDLMIFGLRSLFESDFLEGDGSVALSRLVSTGVRPILAVSSQYRPIRRVLLAYSGSIESASTIKRFVTSQPWSGLSFKLITFEHSPEEAQILLSDMASYCRAHGHDAEIEYVAGSPKYKLLESANDWDADLIVLGSSARRLWLKRLLGEAAMHVIRHADIPLFLGQ